MLKLYFEGKYFGQHIMWSYGLVATAHIFRIRATNLLYAYTCHRPSQIPYVEIAKQQPSNLVCDVFFCDFSELHKRPIFNGTISQESRECVPTFFFFFAKKSEDSGIGAGTFKSTRPLGVSPESRLHEPTGAQTLCQSWASFRSVIGPRTLLSSGSSPDSRFQRLI